MLRRLTRTSRVRMAITFAAAYLLCVLTPPVALAFVGGLTALHCLTGSHHHNAAMGRDAHTHSPNAGAHSGAGHSHSPAVHSDSHAGHDHAGSHHHADAADHHAVPAHASLGKGDGSGTDAGCCGVFCVSAMPAGLIADVLPLPGMPPAAAAAEPGIAGRGPGRIDRPPNVSLPY